MKESGATAIYFLFSIIITYFFITASPVYHNLSFQLLAFGIAGMVWGIQIISALLILKSKKYLFLYHAGRVCFWGSARLLASVVINFFIKPSHTIQLQISALNVLVSVLLMAVMFVLFLKKIQLSYAWVIVWLLCLCLAIPLQAELVGLL